MVCAVLFTVAINSATRKLGTRRVAVAATTIATANIAMLCLAKAFVQNISAARWCNLPDPFVERVGLIIEQTA